MKRLPGLILLAGLLAGAALIVLHIRPVLFVWLSVILAVGLWSRRRLGQAFTCDGTAFTAEASYGDHVAVAVWLSGAIGQAPAFFGTASTADHVGAVALLAVAVLLLAHGVWTWLRPPVLALTPHGVAVRTAYRLRRFGWDELTGPVVAQRAYLTVGGRRIWTAGLRTDPAFLARAIDFYRTHPEHRPAIGTPGEHLRWSS